VGEGGSEGREVVGGRSTHGSLGGGGLRREGAGAGQRRRERVSSCRVPSMNQMGVCLRLEGNQGGEKGGWMDSNEWELEERKMIEPRLLSPFVEAHPIPSP